MILSILRRILPEIIPFSSKTGIFTFPSTCQEQQLELDMEQWTGSKLVKEFVKAV